MAAAPFLFDDDLIGVPYKELFGDPWHVALRLRDSSTTTSESSNKPPPVYICSGGNFRRSHTDESCCGVVKICRVLFIDTIDANAHEQAFPPRAGPPTVYVPSRVNKMGTSAQKRENVRQSHDCARCSKKELHKTTIS